MIAVEKTDWGKALTISLVIHITLLLGFGLIIVMAPEQYIELELGGGGGGGGSGGGNDEIAVFAADTSAADTSAASIPSVPETPSTYQEQEEAVESVEENISQHPEQPQQPKEPPANAVFAAKRDDDAKPMDKSSGSGSGLGTGSGSGVGSGSGSGSGSGVGSGAGSGIGPGSGPGSGDSTAPRILAEIKPSYPLEARKAGWEGTVVLRIQIMENGAPGQVTVYRSSGYDLLDEAAISAVRQWRFVPAKNRFGQVIRCSTTLPVIFKLRA
ncbi:energy transducer TonB [Acetonema longum]|uniref:TonB family protein n=1 Tax=Acetonema longum DSM 6540 TaxID=1009370 RepID=F7NPW5_9FIRM|nr:energy transducer TonB [Acetonema longum]EGO61956.1 TonB family protein [Acetonema longum DSM 6540]